MTVRMRWGGWQGWACVVACAGLTACGGGGGSAGSSVSGGYAPASVYADQCAVPRASAISASGSAKADRAGSLDTEKSWVRSFVNDTYLWYTEVGDVSPTGYPSAASYFNVLKTNAKTASGAPKDKFHFTYDTTAWVQESQAGVSYGYGITWALLAATPPRSIVAAMVDSGTAADAQGIRRGAKLVSVDGVDVTYGTNVAVLNEGTWPTTTASHTLGLQDPGSSAVRYVTLTPANLTTQSVRNVGTVAGYPGLGYMAFTTHIATSERDLVAGINQLKAAAVTDLVLDLRYNGGGYLDIASELAYMIAGPTPTAGRTFEKLIFNDKNPFNVTPSQAITPFWSTSQGFSVPSGQALPYLGLSRLYVLTSASTCSASESIINSLRGVGVTVHLVGGTTCGKPYGFIPQDNCGTTYFAIQFQGVNDKGFGDYSDGFSPTCFASDDFSQPLGSAAEGQLAAALKLRANGTCSASASPPAAALPAWMQAPSQDPSAMVAPFHPLNSSRIHRP